MSPTYLLEDRAEAGRLLAERLERYRAADPVVLALPRGGVPVAAEVAQALDAPLDVAVARKIGAPGHPEWAIGAVAPGGVQLFDPEAVRFLGLSGADLDRLVARARVELDRRVRRFRGDGGFPDVRDRTVVLVDDGLATGATAHAAVQALRRDGAARVVLAVGVAPPETAAWLRREVDDLVCLYEPEPFAAVGAWYRHFDQVSDDEVIALIRATHRGAGAERGPRPRADSAGSRVNHREDSLK